MACQEETHLYKLTSISYLMYAALYYCAKLNLFLCSPLRLKLSSLDQTMVAKGHDLIGAYGPLLVIP
jgi:hypothetical protein